MEMTQEHISLLNDIFGGDGEFWILMLLAFSAMIASLLFAYKLHIAYNDSDITDSLVSENSKYNETARKKHLKAYKIRMGFLTLLFATIAITLYIISFSHI